MVRALALALLVACGDSDPLAPRVLTFGPYTIQPGEERVDQCVSATLHNDEPLYVNSVALATGAGFHHSNWFWLPENQVAGADGTWTCSDRNFNDVVAGLFGGVLFAQSTQASHETQEFAPGVAIVVPPHSKIIGDTHLLNASDSPITVPVSLVITPIAAAKVTTQLAAMSFEDQALGIPPHRMSRFTVECDLGPKHQQMLGRAPDFSLYYALPHYHALGTGLVFEAIRDDGTADLIYSTTNRIGDTLGGLVDPAFAMVGHSKLRFSCTYDNPTDQTIVWGYGGEEMCVFLAFTDSPLTWAGGALSPDMPGPGVDDGTYVNFTHACEVVATAANF